MSVEYRLGDVFARLAEISDGSIDLVVTSPPFLALRSYLPADHPDKDKEIGSEPSPAEFIDTLLELSAEFARVLAPHGSICVELGDTFSGSGGSGGDYSFEGLRAGQQRFSGSAKKRRARKYSDDRGNPDGMLDTTFQGANTQTGGGSGWPLAKSMTLIPHLFTASLAYGRNLLTGAASPSGDWRVRNVICWARPNPPVGALGDKFRPATSYITVACKGAKRYFDLDAVRTEHRDFGQRYSTSSRVGIEGRNDQITSVLNEDGTRRQNPAGAPPLDWHIEEHPEDGDWLWKMSARPYKGSHYATYPLELPTRLIKAMCPQRVCTMCGKPSTRIVESGYADRTRYGARERDRQGSGRKKDSGRLNHHDHPPQKGWERERETVGWSDCCCGEACVPAKYFDVEVPAVCDDDGGVIEESYTCKKMSDPGCCDGSHWRTGVVLDPFIGSGTTLEAAQVVGRDAIGIDLDDRNADLARERVGMFMSIDEAAS